MATKQGHVCIFELAPEMLASSRPREQHVHPVAVLTDHAPNSVQRVSWNITGALLSSSDKRGNLKLWQCSPGESFSEWHCVGSVASNNAGDGEHGVTPVRTDPLSSAVG